MVGKEGVWGIDGRGEGGFGGLGWSGGVFYRV